MGDPEKSFFGTHAFGGSLMSNCEQSGTQPCGCAGVCRCIGVSGDAGLQGPPGLVGETGATGPKGQQGVSIVSMTQVNPTTVNFNLSDGTTIGPAVLPIGPQGIQGIQGLVGLTGPQGAAGTNGTNGVDGTSVIGVQQMGPGVVQFQFSDGTNSGSIQLPVGPTGPTGATGVQGPIGPNGINGLNGVSVTGITQLGPNSIVFEYSNGLNSGPILLPAGPAGPAGISPSSGVATDVSAAGVVDVRIDGTTIDLNANNELTVDACGVITKALALTVASAPLATDIMVVKDASGNCVSRFVPKSGIPAVSGLGSTVSNAGVVDVNVDAVTIKLVANALTVDPCEVNKKAIATGGASTPSQATDKFFVIDAAGACKVRNIAAASTTVAGTATSITAGTGAINVVVDGTTVKVVANALTVDACETLKAGVAANGAAGAIVATDKVLVLDAANVCRVRNIAADPFAKTGPGLLGSGTVADPLKIDSCTLPRPPLRTVVAAAGAINPAVVDVFVSTGGTAVSLADPTGAPNCSPNDVWLVNRSLVDAIVVTPVSGLISGATTYTVPAAGGVGSGPAGRPSIHLVRVGGDWEVI
jgi:hypothetical protein